MLSLETKKYGSVEVHLLYYDGFKMSEHLHRLLPDEWEKLSKIKHPIKKREFVATRVLRDVFFGDQPILYNGIGAPYIESQGFISISHANCVVGLAFCKDFPIGLDLEPLRDKVLRVKHKFLSPQETLLNDTDSVEEMIKIWSGKEALYKLAGRKKIIFSEQLFLTKKDDLNWLGEMIFNDSKRRVELVIDKIDNFVISINIDKVYEF